MSSDAGIDARTRSTNNDAHLGCRLVDATHTTLVLAHHPFHALAQVQRHNLAQVRKLGQGVPGTSATGTSECEGEAHPSL